VLTERAALIGLDEYDAELLLARLYKIYSDDIQKHYPLTPEVWQHELNAKEVHGDTFTDFVGKKHMFVEALDTEPRDFMGSMVTALFMDSVHPDILKWARGFVEEFFPNLISPEEFLVTVGSVIKHFNEQDNKFVEAFSKMERQYNLIADTVSLPK